MYMYVSYVFHVKSWVFLYICNSKMSTSKVCKTSINLHESCQAQKLNKERRQAPEWPQREEGRARKVTR